MLPSFGGFDEVAEQHRDRGRPDTADPRRDVARDLLARSSTSGSSVRPSYRTPAPTTTEPGRDVLGLDDPRHAGRGDHDVGPAAC